LEEISALEEIILANYLVLEGLNPVTVDRAGENSVSFDSVQNSFNIITKVMDKNIHRLEIGLKDGQHNFDFNSLKIRDYLDMTEITTPAVPAADTLRLFVEDFKGFPFYSFIDSTGMVRKIVRDSVFVGKNVTGTAIAASRIVYASGSVDDVPTIALAQADSAATMPAIGVTVERIEDGDFGRIMQVGLLEDVNTGAYSVGDILYVSATTAGVPTATAPTYPNLRQEIGTILVDSATVGSIQIVARTAFDDGLITSLDLSGTLKVDTIDEHTAAAGVTIESVLLKDGLVQLNDGTAAAPSLTFVNDSGLNTGLYLVAENTLGFTVAGIEGFRLATDGLIMGAGGAGGGAGRVRLTNVAGTVALPCYTFTSDSTSGMYRIAAHQIGFAVNAQLQLAIEDGTVRVGAANYDRLEIADDHAAKAVLQKDGDDDFSIYFNAFYNGSFDNYVTTDHAFRIRFEGGPSAANLHVYVAQPTAGAPSFIELVKLTEDGDLYSLGQTWQDYYSSSTVTGWSGTPNPNLIYYKRLGNLCFVAFDIDGTSNSATTSFTLPYSAASGVGIYSFIRCANNGTWDSEDSYIYMAAGGNTVTAYRNDAGTAWTASGRKVIRGRFWYEVA
jgi:hypothetical protein